MSIPGVVMARRKPRRKFPFKIVPIQSSSAIGALASLDVVSAVVGTAASDTYRLKSLKASYSVADLGASIDDAFQFGIAHSDYTAAEIEECLEAAGAIDFGDKIAQEQANRLVRRIGTITNMGTGVAGTGLPFNDGKPVSTKLNWLMAIGDQLQIWVRNGSGVVYTTGALLTLSGHIVVQVPV